MMFLIETFPFSIPEWQHEVVGERVVPVLSPSHPGPFSLPSSRPFPTAA